MVFGNVARSPAPKLHVAATFAAGTEGTSNKHSAMINEPSKAREQANVFTNLHGILRVIRGIGKPLKAEAGESDRFVGVIVAALAETADGLVGQYGQA